MADKKITLLGSAITDLPNTSIALLQKSLHRPFQSVRSEVSATQNKISVQSFVLELLQMMTMYYFLMLLLNQLI
jgi:hypothetical protein